VGLGKNVTLKALDFSNNSMGDEVCVWDFVFSF
jgi:hypothetical protein